MNIICKIIFIKISINRVQSFSFIELSLGRNLVEVYIIELSMLIICLYNKVIPFVPKTI